MSNYYFGKQERGGIIASNIEHQDVVATILAIESLTKTYNVTQNNSTWKIMCEGYVDIEFIFPNERVFIEVKSELIEPAKLWKIISKFKKDFELVKDKNPDYVFRFRVHALRGLSTKLVSLESKLKELHNSYDTYPPAEYQAHLLELCSQYPKLDSEIAPHLKIDTRRLLKDSDEPFALFSDYLRRAYPIRDYGNELLQQIFNELLEVFA